MFAKLITFVLPLILFLNSPVVLAFGDYIGESMLLKSRLNELGVPATYSPENGDGGVAIDSDHVIRYGCQRPLCRLLRRIAILKGHPVIIKFTVDENAVYPSHPNEVNIGINSISTIQHVKDFVVLSKNLQWNYVVNPIEILRHELAHSFFYTESKSENFFSGVFHLRNLGPYNTFNLSEMLAFAMENEFRVRNNSRFFNHQNTSEDAIFEMNKLFHALKEFVSNSPRSIVLEDISSFKSEFGNFLDENELIKSASFHGEMAGFSVPKEKLQRKFTLNDSKYRHFLIARNGRSFSFDSNYKIEEIQNWDQFLHAFRFVASHFNSINRGSNTEIRESARKIRKAFFHEKVIFQGPSKSHSSCILVYQR